MTTSSSEILDVPSTASIVTMRQYIEEKQINRQENPLKWCHARGILYPELANLAKKNIYRLCQHQ